MSKKIRADSILGNLTAERQAEIAEYARSHSMAETKAWLAADGLRISMGSLSDWFSSWRLQQQFRVADADALNFIELLRKKRPELPETELQSWASEFFQMQAVKSGDSETFLAFATARHKAEMDRKKFEQRERELAQDREKWLATQKTKIEAGLDALYQEIKGSSEARELFQRFKAVVTKATAA